MEVLSDFVSHLNCINKRMLFIRLSWLTQLYYMFCTYRAGAKKRFLPIEADGTMFSYIEKGCKTIAKPTIVFVHGLSSNKETWLPIIQQIPGDYHCVAVDLPAHGETVGLNEHHYTIDKFVDKLKLFFDNMGLAEPMCIVGASIGGTIVSMFSVKYPSYVSMICLLAPPANKESETDLIRQLHDGIYTCILPETIEQLHYVINEVIVKKANIPQLFLNGYLELRLLQLEEHKKVLGSLPKYDYPKLDQYYQKLRQMTRPALILWGHQDRLYTEVGAEYFSKLIPKAELSILDDCGHFMAIDKPEEIAERIRNFSDKYYNHEIYITLRMGIASSTNKVGSVTGCSYELMLRRGQEEAKSMDYVEGKASGFYFDCRNGDIDRVIEALNTTDAPTINELNCLQPNGSTPLHAATFRNHIEIVKLLLEKNCCRTTLNRFGKTAYEEAQTIEMQQLFHRSDSTDRFHDSDAEHTMTVCMTEETKKIVAGDEALNYVHVLKSKNEIHEHILSEQTVAMWIKFYNWFGHTFPNLIERDDYHVDGFDLCNDADFHQFLTSSLPHPAMREMVLKSLKEAKKNHSIKPLITLYTSAKVDLYRPLNYQLAHSISDAHMSPHLVDRFVMEFRLYSHELEQRAFKGITYRGATLSTTDLAMYKRSVDRKLPVAICCNAFTSTSTNPLIAFKFAHNNPPSENKKNIFFIFEIAEESPAIFGIKDISYFGYEQEVLILPGNVFTIIEVIDPHGIDVTQIRLRHMTVNVSFFQKLKQTIRSANKGVL